MQFDPVRVRHNAILSSTQDLLERVTVLRAGMEPEAIVIIENELASRGVTAEEIAALRRQADAYTVRDSEGHILPCRWCHRPAVSRKRAWWKLFGVLPLFPQSVPACENHGGQMPPR